MNRKRRARSICFALLLIALFVLFSPSMFHVGNRWRLLARAAQTRVEMLNFTEALTAYSNQFGVPPVGDNAAVTPMLTGSNKQHLNFLKHAADSKRFNQRGEFQDPNGHPYDIEVMTNQIRITPRAK